MKTSKQYPNGTNYADKSSSYPLVAATDDVIDFTAAATATLPSAIGIAGKIFTIINSVGGYNVTLATTLSQTIGGYASGVILLTSKNDVITVQSGGSNWLIIRSNIVVGMTTNQQLLSGAISGTTIAKFTSIAKDNYSFYNTSTGQATIKIEGWYDVDALLEVTSSSATVGQSNGAVVSQSGSVSKTYQNYVFVQSTSVLTYQTPIHTTLYCAVNDIVTVSTACNTTGPAWSNGAAGSWMSIRRRGVI